MDKDQVPGDRDDRDRRGGTDLLERPVPLKKVQTPRMYQVILHNDDFTPMEFVVHVLERVFSKSREQAVDLTMHAHKHGSAPTGTYTYDIANTLASRGVAMARREQHPLMLDVQPAPEA